MKFCEEKRLRKSPRKLVHVATKTNKDFRNLQVYLFIIIIIILFRVSNSTKIMSFIIVRQRINCKVIN